MKISKNVTEVHTNNKNTEKFEFSIGDSAKAIAILREDYSNPIQALVQEYISNARDACRESKKNDNDFVVTAPATKNLTFKVRDFGPGMSLERIQNVFTKYTVSTKDKDNRQTGGFGLGCKSAWAYTDNFTLVNYYGGKATTYVAYSATEEHPAGVLEKVSEVPTKEPNGVEIQVALTEKSDVESFHEAILRAVYFWEDRPKIEGMELPDGFLNPNKIKVESGEVHLNTREENIFHDMFNRLTDQTVVMDGIPYPLPEDSNLEEIEEIDAIRAACQGVAAMFVNIGEVAINSTREDLKDDKAGVTREALKKAAKNLKKDLDQLVQDEGKKSKNLQDFLDKMNRLYKFLDLKQMKPAKYCEKSTVYNFNGDLIESTLFSKINIERLILSEGRRSSKVKLKKNDHYRKNDFNSVFIYQDESMGQAARTLRIKQLLAQTGKDKAFVFSAKDDQLGPCLELAKTSQAYKLSEVHVTRSPRESNGEKRQKVKLEDNQISLMQLSHGTTYTSVYDLSQPNDKDRVYVVREQGNEKSKVGNYKEMVKTLEKLEKEICFISKKDESKVLGKKGFLSIETFFSELPKHVSKKHFKELVASVKKQICNQALNDFESIIGEKPFQKIVGKIKDKKLRDNLETLIAVDSEKTEFHSEDSKLLSEYVTKHIPEIDELKVVNDLGDYVKKNYSLFEVIKDSYYYGDKTNLCEHLLKYLNAVY